MARKNTRINRSRWVDGIPFHYEGEMWELYRQISEKGASEKNTEFLSLLNTFISALSISALITEISDYGFIFTPIDVDGVYICKELDPDETYKRGDIETYYEQVVCQAIGL